MKTSTFISALSVLALSAAAPEGGKACFTTTVIGHPPPCPACPPSVTSTCITPDCIRLVSSTVSCGKPGCHNTKTVTQPATCKPCCPTGCATTTATVTASSCICDTVTVTPTPTVCPKKNGDPKTCVTPNCIILTTSTKSCKAGCSYTATTTLPDPKCTKDCPGCRVQTTTVTDGSCATVTPL